METALIYKGQKILEKCVFFSENGLIIISLPFGVWRRGGELHVIISACNFVIINFDFLVYI